jgi:hypothetical protein
VASCSRLPSRIINVIFVSFQFLEARSEASSFWPCRWVFAPSRILASPLTPTPHHARTPYRRCDELFVRKGLRTVRRSFHYITTDHAASSPAKEMSDDGPGTGIMVIADTGTVTRAARSGQRHQV